MADDVDILIKFCEEHWEEMRHIEDQRATITNIVIVVTSVVIGFLTQQTPTLGLLPVSVLLIMLGIYGTITTAKLYERHQFAQGRLDRWYKRIDELKPNAQFLLLRDVSDTEHKKKFPMSKFRLHHLWIALHVAILLLGIGITIFIITSL